MRWWLLCIGAVLVSADGVSLTPYANPTPATAPLALSPCHVQGLAEEVRCGVHEVLEDRADGAGRRLPIQVAVLPALRRGPEADPLFIFAGGPGQGARGFAPVAARYFREIRRSRDIVLVDLRGTGGSAPLRCPAADDELSALAPDAQAVLVRQCLDGIDAGVRHYTHSESLADLDEVRQRLGYARINLWGGSWGTRAALLYALRFPHAVRQLVLDGAVPLDLAFPVTASASAQAALDRLLSGCAADADCAAAFPDPRGLMAALVLPFSDGPRTVRVPHPRTGAMTEVVLTRDAVVDIVRGALYVPRDAALLLPIVAHAVRGDYAPLAAQYIRTASVTTDDMALGATLSVLCSEDVPFAPPADIAAAARGSYFGTGYAAAWTTRCGQWPRGAAIVERAGAVSAAPALVISGEHDPVTPPAIGERMRRHFASSWHIVVPGAAHNASFAGCVPGLIAAFVERGTGDGIDTSCAADVTWPPFAVGNAGTRP